MFSPIEIAVVLMFGFFAVLAAAMAVWVLYLLMRKQKPRDDEPS
jgi:hypothetical protein